MMKHRLLLIEKKSKKEYVVDKIIFEGGEIRELRAESIEADENGHYDVLYLTYANESAKQRFKRQFRLKHIVVEKLYYVGKESRVERINDDLEVTEYVYLTSFENGEGRFDEDKALLSFESVKEALKVASQIDGAMVFVEEA